MNPDETVGARFALWWVGVVTRTADSDTARDRRAEVASDVHEQLNDAWRRDGSATPPSVVARVLRGIPADIAWRVGLELRASRVAWHLRNPSTTITTLFVAMLPLNVAADTNIQRSRTLIDYYSVPLWAATNALGCCILLFAVLALATRTRPRWTAAAEQFQPGSRLERARRCTTASLGVTLAGSAVFRFGALDSVGGVFWFAFAGFVLLYLILLVTTICSKALILGRYLPKITA